MSMVGAQEQLSEDHSGEAWELLGRDMIRTRDSRQIVAQFWTSPSETDARLIAAAPELLEALKIVAGSENWRCSEDGEWDIVNAAIAKAEGRS